MANPKALELLPTLARTGTGEVAATVPSYGPNKLLELELDVTDVPDTTPSLTVYIETSLTGSNWVQAAVTSPAVAAAGAQKFLMLTGGRHVRARWVITNGEFTFSVSGTVEQIYVGLADLEAVAPATMLAPLSIQKLLEACLQATDEAAAKLSKSFTMPITAWSRAMRLHVARMAVYHAMTVHGFNPEPDGALRLGYEDALKWLSTDAANDDGIVDSTPTVRETSGIEAVSEAPRGWGSLFGGPLLLRHYATDEDEDED